MPIWLFLSILQLKIPLNLFLRTCCIDEVENYKQTWGSAILIFVGTVINLFRLSGEDINNREDKVGFDFFNFLILIFNFSTKTAIFSTVSFF